MGLAVIYRLQEKTVTLQGKRESKIEYCYVIYGLILNLKSKFDDFCLRFSLTNPQGVSLMKFQFKLLLKG